MATPPVQSAAQDPLDMALRLTRRFVSIFYALLALLLALLSAVPPLLTLHMAPATLHRVLLVTPLIALPLLAATLWRRHVVLHRLSAVADALDDGALLQRPEEGLTRLASLDNCVTSASLPQLSDRLKSLSNSMAAPLSSATPLLFNVTAPLHAAFSSLATHPIVKLHGLLSRLFQTLGIIAIVHPLLSTVLGGAAWLVSVRKGSVMLNVLSAVSGTSSQLATWAVRRKVLRLVADAVERLVDEEVERRKADVSDALTSGIMSLGGAMVEDPMAFDVPLRLE